jgi:hypothetical protein
MMNRVKRHRAVRERVRLDHDEWFLSMRVLSYSVSQPVSKAGHQRAMGYENEVLIGSYTIL